MKISGALIRRIKSGRFMPPFFYGLAYWEYTHDVAVFLPIPINLIVRAYKYIQLKWNMFRGKRTWVDKYIENMRSDITKAAYDSAYKDLENWKRDYIKLIEKEIKERREI